MTQPLEKVIQGKAYRIVKWQLIGVFLLSCFICLFGLEKGFSALAGGLAFGLPNLFFVWRVFRFARASEMSKFMAAFFAGEVFKLIFSGFLFILVVKYLPVSLLFVLIGFAGAILSFWCVCIWQFTKKAV